jgi:hypothetical protein
LREKQKHALALEASKFYSDTDVLKPLWKYKEQLIAYCWQDVIVLLLGCRAYRSMFMGVREEDADAAAEFGWRPNSVDPFQYLTQSQVLQEWALAGSDTQIARIPYKCTSRQ